MERHQLKITLNSCKRTRASNFKTENNLGQWEGPRNTSVDLSLTSVKNEKVEHYIRIKIYKFIILKFYVEIGINILCD